jgi:hypothetical protein
MTQPQRIYEDPLSQSTPSRAFKQCGCEPPPVGTGLPGTTQERWVKQRS